MKIYTDGQYYYKIIKEFKTTVVLSRKSLNPNEIKDGVGTTIHRYIFDKIYKEVNKKKESSKLAFIQRSVDFINKIVKK